MSCRCRIVLPGSSKGISGLVWAIRLRELRNTGYSGGTLRRNSRLILRRWLLRPTSFTLHRRVVTQLGSGHFATLDVISVNFDRLFVRFHYSCGQTVY